MRPLTPEQRGIVMRALEAGKSVTAAAKAADCHKSSVSRLVYALALRYWRDRKPSHLEQVIQEWYPR